MTIICEQFSFFLKHWKNITRTAIIFNNIFLFSTKKKRKERKNMFNNNKRISILKTKNEISLKNIVNPLKDRWFFHLFGTTRRKIFLLFFWYEGTPFLPWRSCMDRWPKAWPAHGGWEWHIGGMVHIRAGSDLLRKTGDFWRGVRGFLGVGSQTKRRGKRIRERRK